MSVQTDIVQQFINDPYSFFKLAHHNQPIQWVDFFNVQGWLVTGYKECENILKDPRFIKEAKEVAAPEHLQTVSESLMPVVNLTRNMMLFRDAPNHTRLRGLVNKAFTPKVIERLRPAIYEIAQNLIEEKKGQTEHELIRDFAYTLPVMVITELIGVPKEDSHFFRKWSESFIKFIDINTTEKDWEEAAPDLKAADQYMRELITVKRSAHGDDLLSGLISASDSGDKLNEDELVATCLLLLIAGHETTVNLITNGYYLLLKHPSEMEKLKNNPSLLANAVEEVLRFDPPVLLTTRWISEDMEFCGQPLKKGEVALIALGAANRDEAVNEVPEIFDIARNQVKHLSFASGAHFCLGAPLARLEAQIAFELLLTRFQDPELLQEPVRRANIIFRGFEGLRFKAHVQ